MKRLDELKEKIESDIKDFKNPMSYQDDDKYYADCAAKLDYAEEILSCLNEKSNTLSFEEIFNQPGIYRADGFGNGVCFEINKDGNLFMLFYDNANDLLPRKEPAPIYKGLFTKQYKQVYNIKELFGE
jgi:hypothetical protein